MKKLAALFCGVVLLLAGFVAVSTNAFAAAGDPVIAGSGKVGGTLAITFEGDFGQAPDDFDFEWRHGGEDTTLDHGRDYVVKSSDIGQEISVLVTAYANGDILDRKISNAILAVGMPPSVTISGSPRVGKTLSSTVTGGSGSVINWTLDGTEIRDASGVSYDVVKEDAGHAIALRATSTGPDATETDSAPKRIAAYNSTRPSMSGTFKAGRTVKANKGTWYGYRYSYSYRWYRSHHRISGATKSSYRLTKSDRRRTITVKVIAQRSGYPTVSAETSGRRVS